MELQWLVSVGYFVSQVRNDRLINIWTLKVLTGWVYGIFDGANCLYELCSRRTNCLTGSFDVNGRLFRTWIAHSTPFRLRTVTQLTKLLNFIEFVTRWTDFTFGVISCACLTVVWTWENHTDKKDHKDYTVKVFHV